MLGSIEIEHLARDHFEIPFRATMRAAQIALIEDDHDRRSHRVNVGICDSLRMQPRDMLADAACSIGHRAAVDGAAHGQHFRKQIGNLRKSAGAASLAVT